MAFEELAHRLNEPRYKNWLKAAQCLRVLKEGLSPYTEQEMRRFHGDQLNQNAALRRPCRSACSLRDKKVLSLCPLCSEWSKVILRHHRQPDATSVNWENCRPERWSQDHWELAKAYMPRGLYKVQAFDQCDASALLNLLNFCQWFSAAEPRIVREVIRYRNDLMHSFDMRMDNGWMGRYHHALTQLLLRLSHQWAPLAKAQQQIEAIFAVDWSTCITGLDQMDTADDRNGLQLDSGSQWDADTAESIGQLEVELLGERLQELLGDTESQNAECLQSLSGFLQANADLAKRFSAELRTIGPREAASSTVTTTMPTLTGRDGRRKEGEQDMD